VNATRLSEVTTYQSPWLKAEDLQGRAVIVVVELAVVEDIRTFDGKREAKVIVTFKGKTKRLILNKTQAFALASCARTDVFADWKGLAVTLKPAMTRSGKSTIEILPAPPSAPTVEA